MNPRRVWILPGRTAGGQTFFKWDNQASSWKYESRLIPITATLSANSRGAAQFQVVRTRKMDPGTLVPQRAPDQLSPGQWVVVCSAPDVNGQPAFDWNKVEWAGAVESFDAGLIPGVEPSYNGTMTANGLGTILDQIIPEGWLMSDGSTGTVIQSPQPANIPGHNGVLIGNYESAVTPGGAFAALRSQCGVAGYQLWTRKRLADHVITRGMPDGCGDITIVADTSVSDFIQDTTAPESWDVAGMAIGQIFDLLFSRSYGISWTIRIATNGDWQLVVYALLTEGDTGVPVATGTDIDLRSEAVASQPRVVWDTSSVYDEIRLVGGPIVFAGALATKDGWADKGWSATALTAYKAGASTAFDYGDLSLSQQADRNAQVRGGASLSAVFSRFLIGPGTNTGPMKTSATPGVGTPTTNFFPLITWDGTTATANLSEARDPAWPTTQVERIIPWKRGVSANGTAYGLADDDASPSYLPPLAFARVQSRGTDEPLWYDLGQEYGRRPGFGLDLDDRAPGIRLIATPAEWLAKGDWTGMEPSSLSPTAEDAADLEAVGVPVVDWRDVVLTVAIPSAQKIEIKKLRSGSTAGLARKTLTIDAPELQSWWVHAGAIVGAKPKATTDEQIEPDVIAALTHVRNDWPTAQRLANLAAAYAFSERITATIELGNIDSLPAWAKVGTMIGRMTDLGGYYVWLDTAVEEVTYRWQEGRVTVRTDLPPAPAWMSRINQSASPSLGGSMASSVVDLQKRADRAEERGQNVPVVPQKPGAAAAPATVYRQLLIGSGNTLATIAALTIKGLKRASTLTSVPTLVPTSITATYPDGLTAAYDLGTDPSVTTGPLVWVTSAATITIKNPAGGADTTASNLLRFQIAKDSLILSLSSYQVPCAAGGYATVYVPYVVGA